jgi:hypothetical protein
MTRNARGRDGALHATAGDRLVIQSLRGPVRDAEILEVRHPDGTPPYTVRWSDTGHEALVYPGADAFVQHFNHRDPSQEASPSDAVT